MATAKYGTPSPQWWKHLRDWKRVFWKRNRKQTAQVVKRTVREL